MMVGQSSPVAILNRIIIAIPKLVKFILSSMIYPFVTLPNIYTPNTANMKNTSISRASTFISDGNENIIV